MNRNGEPEFKDVHNRIARAQIPFDEVQDSISLDVAKYMAHNGIGIVELTKRLNGDFFQATKLLKGSQKLRLGALIKMGALMGKKVKVSFE